MLPQFKIYIQIIYINLKKYTKIIQKFKSPKNTWDVITYRYLNFANDIDVLLGV